MTSTSGTKRQADSNTGVNRYSADRQIITSFLWEIRVVFDFANLLDVSLGVRGDFQHPLPTIDDLRTLAKTVATQIVVCRLDVFDHRGAKRLKLAKGLVQVFI